MLSRPELQGSRSSNFRRESMAAVRRSLCRSQGNHVSFGVIQADDYDAAVAIARACPGDNVIEIREMAGYT